jgi:hypothetical protein
LVINERPIAVGAGYMVELLVEVGMGMRWDDRLAANTGRAHDRPRSVLPR